MYICTYIVHMCMHMYIHTYVIKPHQRKLKKLFFEFIVALNIMIPN